MRSVHERTGMSDSDADLPDLVNSSSSDGASDDDSSPRLPGVDGPARDEVCVPPAVPQAGRHSRERARKQGSSDETESARSAPRAPEPPQAAPAQPAKPAVKPGFLSAPAREPARKRNDVAAESAGAGGRAKGGAVAGSAAAAAGGPPKSVRSGPEMRADRLEEVARRPKNGPLDAKLDQVEPGMLRKHAEKRPYASLTLGWRAPGVDGMLPGGSPTFRP